MALCHKYRHLAGKSPTIPVSTFTSGQNILYFAFYSYSIGGQRAQSRVILDVSISNCQGHVMNCFHDRNNVWAVMLGMEKPRDETLLPLHHSPCALALARKTEKKERYIWCPMGYPSHRAKTLIVGVQPDLHSNNPCKGTTLGHVTTFSHCMVAQRVPLLRNAYYPSLYYTGYSCAQVYFYDSVLTTAPQVKTTQEPTSITNCSVQIEHALLQSGNITFNEIDRNESRQCRTEGKYKKANIQTLQSAYHPTCGYFMTTVQMPRTQGATHTSLSTVESCWLSEFLRGSSYRHSSFLYQNRYVLILLNRMTRNIISHFYWTAVEHVAIFQFLKTMSRVQDYFLTFAEKQMKKGMTFSCI